jgi:hypothetical protein
MSRPITASWILNAEELSSALKHHVVQSNLRIIFLGVIGVVCLMFAGILAWSPGALQWRACVDSIWMLLFSFLWWGLMFSQGMAKVVMARRLRLWPEEEKTFRWTISEETLTSQCGSHTFVLRWENVRKVVGTPKGALIYPGSPMEIMRRAAYPFLWLPKRAFRSESEYAGFLHLAKAKVELFREAEA